MDTKEEEKFQRNLNAMISRKNSNAPSLVNWTDDSSAKNMPEAEVVPDQTDLREQKFKAMALRGMSNAIRISDKEMNAMAKNRINMGNKAKTQEEMARLRAEKEEYDNAQYFGY